MKYRIKNDINNLSINSTILICGKKENNIGIVELIDNKKIYILLLDKNGRVVLNENDNWIQLNINDLSTLRYDYMSMINKNVNNIIETQYKLYIKK